MKRFSLIFVLGIIAVLIGACSNGGGFAEVWQPYIDTTRPTLAFFYTDN